MLTNIKSRVLTVFVAVCVLFCFGFVFSACGEQNAQTSHKITFLSGTEENASVLGVVYTNGKEEIELPEIPVRQGYNPADSRFVFYKQIQNPDGTTDKQEYNFEKATFKDKDLEEDLMVYALYVPNQYRIHYIIDGEDVSKNVLPADAQTLSKDEVPTLNSIWYRTSGEDQVLPTPNIAGKIFVAWYFTDQFDQKTTSLKAGTTGEVVLYAYFKDE